MDQRRTSGPAHRARGLAGAAAAHPPVRPLGFPEVEPVCDNRLEPGDRLLHTDGITEARSPDGEFFGEQRLADLVQRGHAAGDPAPQTMRRLVRRVLSHQADQLQDEASIVVVEWLTGEEQRLPLWAPPRSSQIVRRLFAAPRAGRPPRRDSPGTDRAPTAALVAAAPGTV